MDPATLPGELQLGKKRTIIDKRRSYRKDSVFYYSIWSGTNERNMDDAVQVLTPREMPINKIVQLIAGRKPSYHDGYLKFYPSITNTTRRESLATLCKAIPAHGNAERIIGLQYQRKISPAEIVF